LANQTEIFHSNLIAMRYKIQKYLVGQRLEWISGDACNSKFESYRIENFF
jgi:hypothetical protein